MPGVYGDGDLGAVLRQILQRLRGIETQQQSVTSDNKGRPIKTTGLVPGSNPQLYGDMYWDPITGAKLMFQGYDSGADAAYIAFYDSSGNITQKFDFQGQHVYNSSGQEEARLGQLNASPAIYGLGVAPATGGTPGTLQQVGGALYVAAPNTDNVTNTTWSNFGTPSSITAEIGPSGSALITVTAELSTNNTAGCEPQVGVALDGGTPVARLAASVATAAGINGTYCRTYRHDGLTAGSHTWQLAYQVGNPGSASFDVVAMTVQPL